MEKIVFNKQKIGWMSFNFADSAFATIIITVLFSMYFKDIVVGEGELGTALWGRTISISMILVVLFAPVMGAIADFSHSRKSLMVIFTYITVLFTGLLYFVKSGEILMAMLFFIIANFTFNMANVFYNSFLPDVAEKHEIGRISGIAWGIGYLGGLCALFAIMPVFRLDLEAYLNYRYSFIIVALFFFIFSLPTFILLKEKYKSFHHNNNYIITGFHRIVETGKNIKKFKELVKFLISYFIYSDGIMVIVSFAAIYGSTRFGMSTSEMILYFIIAQPSSFIGAVVFGYLLDKIGAKKSISITLLLWILVVLGAYFCVDKYQFYVVGVFAGFCLGAIQANSRTMIAILSPKEKMTEFFGFYSITGRLSILGPLLYGEISRFTGDQRNAILSILIFFVVGFILLQSVNDKRNSLCPEEL